MKAKRPGEEGSLREQFAWTYGHLAMAHAAIEEGATRYERRHYMIGDYVVKCRSRREEAAAHCGRGGPDVPAVEGGT